MPPTAVGSSFLSRPNLDTHRKARLEPHLQVVLELIEVTAEINCALLGTSLWSEHTVTVPNDWKERVQGHTHKQEKLGLHIS